MVALGWASLAGLFAAACVRQAPRLPGSGTRAPREMRIVTLGPEDPGAVAAVPTMVNVLRRTAWVPFVEEQAGLPALSRFGGSPVLRHGEEWPRCGKCEGAMTLFLQLDLSTIPPEMHDSVGAEGILQVFVCVRADTRCMDSYLARQELPPTEEDAASLVRVLSSDPTLQAAPSRLSATYFEPMNITYWHAVDDYPRTTTELTSIYPQLAGSPNLDAWDRSNCAWGEKMGGWPLWGKVPHYMRCVSCDCLMEVVFQFDSDCNLDFVWGRNGTAFVHRCTHCQRMGFSWIDNSST